MEDILCYQFTKYDINGRITRLVMQLNKTLCVKTWAMFNVINPQEMKVVYDHYILIYTTVNGIKHGKMTLTTLNGNVCATGYYRLGILHGTLLIQNSISQTVNYYNGKLHGKYLFKDNDKSEDFMHFNHGILDGKMRWGNDTQYGHKEVNLEYRNGIPHGPETCYYIDTRGNKYTGWTKYYKDGKYHGMITDTDVKKVDGEIVINVIFKAEYADGKLIKSHIMGNDDISYVCEKKFNKTQATCTRGDTVLTRSYIGENGYTKGIIYHAWNEHIDIYESHNRVVSGVWLFYDKATYDLSGLIHCYCLLRNGITMSFHANGRISRITNYVNDYKHGYEKIYNIDGRLIRVCIYKYGVCVKTTTI
ncbi:Hypothetical protein FSTVST1_310 [Faustovirus ST1]|nr:Hypothetical protein FSTVST1_310 [Faustovirus ST1]